MIKKNYFKNLKINLLWIYKYYLNKTNVIDKKSFTIKQNYTSKIKYLWNKYICLIFNGNK